MDKWTKWERVLEILGISLGGMVLGFLISDITLYGRLGDLGAPQDAGTFLRTILMIPVAVIWAVAYGIVRRKCRKNSK